MGEPVERRVRWVESGVSVGAQHKQEGELPSADRAGTAPPGLWLPPAPPPEAEGSKNHHSGQVRLTYHLTYQNIGVRS